MNISTFRHSEPMRPSVWSLVVWGKPIPQAACAELGPHQGFVTERRGFRARLGGGESSLAKLCSRVLELKQILFSIICAFPSKQMFNIAEL